MKRLRKTHVEKSNAMRQAILALIGFCMVMDVLAAWALYAYFHGRLMPSGGMHDSLLLKIANLIYEKRGFAFAATFLGIMLGFMHGFVLLLYCLYYPRRATDCAQCDSQTGNATAEYCPCCGRAITPSEK